MQRMGNNNLKGIEARIAVCTMGVKLPGEVRGYTRFRKIAEMLVRAGFQVDLITSSFQHWDKAQRQIDGQDYTNLPYRVVFIDEPGYAKNLDLRRIASHRVAARNMAAHFARNRERYSLIYTEIPPNDVALACGKAAKAAGIPFVVDVNDLWPEAMRMAVDIPVLSDIAFYPFARDAAKVYRMLDAAVGTSHEYTLRPAKDRTEPYEQRTVYVGNDLAEFDAGVSAYASGVDKPEGQFWVAYAGMLGASYDLATLIQAASACSGELANLRVKILGDGPDREKLESLASRLGAPVDFLGYVDYAHMAAYLSCCDLTVNSLVSSAAQSIPTKIGDYLAAGIPLLNTGASPELQEKIECEGLGVNVRADDATELAAAILELAQNPGARQAMGAQARAVAQRDFDQEQSYSKIVELVELLLMRANS